jgi:hypothetical protein
MNKIHARYMLLNAQVYRGLRASFSQHVVTAVCGFLQLASVGAMLVTSPLTELGKF